MLVLRLLLPDLRWALLLVEWRFMSIHLCLKDPGPNCAVLAVQIGLSHLAHRPGVAIAVA